MLLVLQNNLQQLHAAIQKSVEHSQREASQVKLLAVSKQHPVEYIKMLYEMGVRDFAENKIQEALPKMLLAQELPITWHFIGVIQSNKTKDIAEHFSWVHSLSDIRHAQRLNNQRPAHLPQLNVCLQVNISEEKNKSGVSVKKLEVLAKEITHLPRLTLRGLMTLPRDTDNFNEQRQQFEKVRLAYEQLQEKGYRLDTLSMGMSGDFPAAIAEGATIIRIGTALFGSR